MQHNNGSIGPARFRPSYALAREDADAIGQSLQPGAFKYSDRRMKYNKDQWISSFEDAMVKLRPHTSMRLLTTISLMAWNQKGTKDINPAVAAAEWSKSMDKPR